MVFKEHQETFSPWWEGLKVKTGLPSEPSSNKGISPWVFGLGPNHMILISLNHTHAIWLTYIYKHQFGLEILGVSTSKCGHEILKSVSPSISSSNSPPLCLAGSSLLKIYQSKLPVLYLLLPAFSQHHESELLENRTIRSTLLCSHHFEPSGNENHRHLITNYPFVLCFRSICRIKKYPVFEW